MKDPKFAKLKSQKDALDKAKGAKPKSAKAQPKYRKPPQNFDGNDDLGED